ncbi:hypothetical protein [Nonomuraea sp. NPDC003804]|uniref:hypothetical protein n=1 Tax=Nonomuraea sp. NPDC003804 TaxID=3154547 RepID=UPI0033BC372C
MMRRFATTVVLAAILTALSGGLAQAGSDEPGGPGGPGEGTSNFHWTGTVIVVPKP